MRFVCTLTNEQPQVCTGTNIQFASQVRTASCSGTACVNSFGDEQLAVDMLADKLLFESLKYSVSPFTMRFGGITRALAELLSKRFYSIA